MFFFFFLIFDQYNRIDWNCEKMRRIQSECGNWKQKENVVSYYIFFKVQEGSSAIRRLAMNRDFF